MLNEQSVVDIFKNSLPTITLDLIGSDIYPTEMVKQAKIKPLSLQSEKQILTQDYQGNEYGMLIDIVKQGITNTVDVDNLYLFDIDYLFNAIRIQTHGSKLKVTSKCPKCGHENETNVDLSIVDINKPKTINDIQSAIKVKNVDLIIRIPTVGHYNEVLKITNDQSFSDSIHDFIKRNNLMDEKSMKQIDNTTISDMNVLIPYIYSFNGQELHIKEDFVYLITYLLLLTQSELLSIVPLLQQITKPFDLSKTIECTSCHYQYKISISDFGVDYFFPSNT